jgi:hypothetical protein
MFLGKRPLRQSWDKVVCVGVSHTSLGAEGGVVTVKRNQNLASEQG